MRFCNQLNIKFIWKWVYINLIVQYPFIFMRDLYTLNWIQEHSNPPEVGAFNVFVRGGDYVTWSLGVLWIRDSIEHNNEVASPRCHMGDISNQPMKHAKPLYWRYSEETIKTDMHKITSSIGGRQSPSCIQNNNMEWATTEWKSTTAQEFSYDNLPLMTGLSQPIGGVMGLRWTAILPVVSGLGGTWGVETASSTWPI